MFERNEDYFEPQYAATSLQKHAVRTFGWMTLGLLVTTATAFAVYSTDLITNVLTISTAALTASKKTRKLPDIPIIEENE